MQHTTLPPSLRFTAPDPAAAVEMPGLACDAFPDGIPHDIAYGPGLHLEPDPRQVGLTVFERGYFER